MYIALFTEPTEAYQLIKRCGKTTLLARITGGRTVDLATKRGDAPTGRRGFVRPLNSSTYPLSAFIYTHFAITNRREKAQRWDFIVIVSWNASNHLLFNVANALGLFCNLSVCIFHVRKYNGSKNWSRYSYTRLANNKLNVVNKRRLRGVSTPVARGSKGSSHYSLWWFAFEFFKVLINGPIFLNPRGAMGSDGCKLSGKRELKIIRIITWPTNT